MYVYQNLAKYFQKVYCLLYFSVKIGILCKSHDVNDTLCVKEPLYGKVKVKQCETCENCQNCFSSTKISNLKEIGCLS